MKKINFNMLMTILTILFIFSCSKNQMLSKDFILVAHRGGVVDEERSENSIKGLEEAIQRGYTHIEIDARVTKDGHVVCFHDENLKRETGIDKNISDLTLEELKQIKLLKSQEQIPTFEEYCVRCEGRIDVMVDTKGVSDQFLEQYIMEVEKSLSNHGLLKNALFILDGRPKNNQDKVTERFLGKAMVAWRKDAKTTREMLPQLPKNFNQLYFIFNSPKHFNKDEFKEFHKMGLKIIASVNLSHYKTGDAFQQGQNDVRKMLAWEVDGLQIDSCYDNQVLPLMTKRR